jgi:hypothetical protein
MAVRRVATDFRVKETTVRDKCTRRIGLSNTDAFLEKLGEAEKLKIFLCQQPRFMSFEPEIAQRIGSTTAATGKTAVHVKEGAGTTRIRVGGT